MILAVGLVGLAWLTFFRRRARRAVAVARFLSPDTPTPAGGPPRRRALAPSPKVAPDVAAVVSMPDTVDLLRVAADAGLPVLLAVEAVAPRAPPPWDAALGAAAGAARRGRLLGDALGELLSCCGDPGRRLAIVLRGAGDGADLALGLDRLAIDARDLRRRRTEEAARRVPVRLLAPLVLCALPAFVLLALAPLVAGAFEALRP